MKDDEEYEFYVRSICDKPGESICDLSPVHGFNTGPFRMADTENSTTSLKISPNPLSITGNILIENNQLQEFSIVLIDLQGRTLQQIFNGHMEEGSSKFEINTANLPPGICFLRTLSENDSQTTMLVIQ